MLNDVQGYVIPKARICEGDLDEFAREAQSMHPLQLKLRE
jgi:hypothetical protein